MKLYTIKEVFSSVQGEGVWAGTPMVFVRFAGCNIWTGREQDRVSSARKHAACALHCDTDFVGTNGTNGGKYAAASLVNVLETLRQGKSRVVLTGGEPSLQLDAPLCEALHDQGWLIHVETNGTGKLPQEVDWVTLSPKPPMKVVDQHYDEVKVLHPLFDPSPFAGLAYPRFVQPVALNGQCMTKESVEACLAFIQSNPSWRISVQTHKLLGVQ